MFQPTTLNMKDSQLYQTFTALIGKLFVKEPKAIIEGWVENTEGWKISDSKETITVPSTHDLGYAIHYVIMQNLEGFAKKVNKSAHIGYIITKQSHEKRNGHIFHDITYCICTK